MRVIFRRSSFITAAALICVLFVLSACTKDTVADEFILIDEDLKEVVLQTGLTDNVVSIKSEEWSVSYVKDGVTGELLKDTDGEPLKLESVGEVELKEGWLKIGKTDVNGLKINLAENFTDTPRDFVIGILAGNTQEEMRFVQTRGKDYELVDKEIVEVEGSRRIYKSTEGCSSMTLVNDTDQEKKMEITAVFQDVKYRSAFSSEEYGAFDWINKNNALVSMDELLLNGAVVWSKPVVYQAGTTYEDFIPADGFKQEITVKPYSTLMVNGEIEYLERICTYTFTIKNKMSGNRFKVNGTWEQKIPLTGHTILQ